MSNVIDQEIDPDLVAFAYTKDGLCRVAEYERIVIPAPAPSPTLPELEHQYLYKYPHPDTPYFSFQATEGKMLVDFFQPVVAPMYNATPTPVLSFMIDPEEAAITIWGTRDIKAFKPNGMAEPISSRQLGYRPEYWKVIAGESKRVSADVNVNFKENAFVLKCDPVAVVVQPKTKFLKVWGAMVIKVMDPSSHRTLDFRDEVQPRIYRRSELQLVQPETIKDSES